MKNKKIVLLLICSFILIHLNYVVSYAACPISESTNASASAEAERYYNMLPSALRSQFESEGWEIMISSVTAVNLASAAFGGIPGLGYVAGFTHPLSKMIILSDTDAGGAMNHEMGHYFNYSIGMASESDLFQDIFREEASNLDGGANDYAMSDTGEYFAEAFREYIECAGYLKSCCPRTYSFIDGYMIGYGGTLTNDVYAYTRCESHLLDAVAKATADAAASAARSAAQALLDSGAAVLGTNAPRLDSWLDGYDELIDGINNDPEEYANRKASEWKDYLEGIDWDQKQSDVRDKVHEKMTGVNEKLQDTEYWQQKGKDFGNTINSWFGG